jgi:hypothetical protein
MRPRASGRDRLNAVVAVTGHVVQGASSCFQEIARMAVKALVLTCINARAMLGHVEERFVGTIGKLKPKPNCVSSCALPVAPSRLDPPVPGTGVER